MSNTKFHRAWKNINRRCNEVSHNRYYRYGERGIRAEWKSFEEFKKDMYETYIKHVAKHGEKQTTIDRIDNDGNYSKNNCRWATYKEQAENKSTNRLFTYQNKTMSLRNWSEQLNFSYQALRTRIYNHQWPVERAFTQEPRKSPTY